MGAPIVTINGPLPEAHPFYALVGRVASEWAHLQHILDLAIWDMLGTRPEQAACVTSQIMGVGPRCHAVALLGVQLNVPKDVLKLFKALRSDSFSVADWRNRWVHDPWYHEVPSGKVFQFRAMPAVDPRYGQHEISEEEVKETISRIKALQETALKARAALADALRTLREKPS